MQTYVWLTVNPAIQGTKNPSADLNKLNSAYRTFVNTRLIYQNRTDCQRLSLFLFFFSFRRFLPFTDEVVRQHLSGRDDLGREFTMGLYPMLSDETCYLLAVDLDAMPGSRMPGRCGRPVSDWGCRFLRSAPGRARAPTSGSSLARPFPPAWRETWVPTF